MSPPPILCRKSIANRGIRMPLLLFVGVAMLFVLDKLFHVQV